MTQLYAAEVSKPSLKCPVLVHADIGESCGWGKFKNVCVSNLIDTVQSTDGIHVVTIPAGAKRC